jgi:flagellar motility protein MotE (MotC chaperone)
LVKKWSDVGAGVMQLQSRKDHFIFWAKVNNSVEDDLQDMLSQTKQAQLENRLKDVAVLEEQMHQMLWGWKAEF